MLVESSSFESLLRKSARWFAADCIEEVLHNVLAQGDKEHFDEITSYSPLILKLNYEMMQRGSKMVLADALDMENTVTQNLMADPEFVLGQRFGPETLNEVTSDLVLKYFEPIKEEEGPDEAGKTSEDDADLAR